MKNLLLIRHAKSSWDLPMNDYDRPLAIKGVKDAHLVSSHISKKLPQKFIIWSSSAKRASETAIIFTQNFHCPIESIIFKDELYTFDTSKLYECITSCDDSHDNLILFGHNNAITNFVNKFGDRIIDNVTTSGCVSIQFDTDSWKNISTGKTSFVLFPKHLK